MDDYLNLIGYLDESPCLKLEDKRRLSNIIQIIVSR